jgi:hypothetical protein
MVKNRKARPGILVPVVEEVPRISDTEREELRKSLDRARADIAAGNYDVVTPATLREEFESVLGRRRTRSADKPEGERGRQGLRRGRR